MLDGAGDRSGRSALVRVHRVSGTSALAKLPAALGRGGGGSGGARRARARRASRRCAVRPRERAGAWLTAAGFGRRGRPGRMARDPRDRPGHDGHACLVVDERARRPRPRLPRAPQHFPRAGLGRARPRGDLAERARRRRGGARAAGVAPELDGDRDHEPARDDGRSGTRDRRAGAATRSSGRTAAPPTAAPSCRRS